MLTMAVNSWKDKYSSPSLSAFVKALVNDCRLIRFAVLWLSSSWRSFLMSTPSGPCCACQYLAQKTACLWFQWQSCFLLLDSRDSFKIYIGSYIHVTSWTLRTSTENVNLTLLTLLVYIKTKFVFLCKSE